MQPLLCETGATRQEPWGQGQSGEIERNNDELRLVVAVRLQTRGPEVWTDGAYLLAATRNRVMKELIQKIEARIADRREELEGWGNASVTVSEVLKSEITFLEALLADMKALAE